MESLNDQIDFFFREPNESPNEQINSILYLLRRDIFTCFGHNPNMMEHIPYQALWPGVMGIFAGMLHSFGLYSFHSEKKAKVKEFHFILEREGQIVRIYEGDWYKINIVALCNAFERSINKYYEELVDNIELQENFGKMYPLYGGIGRM